MDLDQCVLGKGGLKVEVGPQAILGTLTYAYNCCAKGRDNV